MVVKKKKIMAEIVATNVVASRPPERRPTATPTARAKINYRSLRPFFYLSPLWPTTQPPSPSMSQSEEEGMLCSKSDILKLA